VTRSLVFLVIFTLMLVACSSDIEPGTTPAQQPTVRGLSLLTVGAADLPEADAFVGTLESEDRGVLAAQVDGRVGRIFVREGEPVKAGQLLLTIEANSATHRLAEAEGAERVATARLELAEKTAARFEQLFAREAVTPLEMDRVRAELESARQSRHSAVAATATARTALGYTRVKAPYAARLVRRQVDEGSTVLPGTPLLVLDRQGEWRVRVQLPESFFGRIAEGREVDVEIPALGRRLGGRIVEVLPATEPQSRAFEAKVALPDAEGLGAGMYARVTLAGSGRSALLVPAAAIVQRGQLSGLYVVEEGRLRFRLVRTGRRVDEQVEVLSGLTGGATIVAAGTEKAHDGARVEP